MRTRDKASPTHYDVPMPDLSRITPGLRSTAELVVTPDHTAPFVGSGRGARCDMGLA